MHNKEYMFPPLGFLSLLSLLQVLEADRSDHEIVNYAIETLVHITSPETYQEELGKSGQVRSAWVNVENNNTLIYLSGKSGQVRSAWVNIKNNHTLIYLSGKSG